MRHALLVLSHILTDKMAIQLRYWYKYSRKINLNNPKTFNEKLQWLKLYDRNPKYTEMVDKVTAKEYVTKTLKTAGIDNPRQYIIPTLGVYKKFKDIDFKKLPNQFVIKCNHDSGGLIIVKNKKEFLSNKHTFKISQKKIEHSLKTNYYYRSREWPYKNVKPQILIEKYMEDKKYASMRDYKFFCFNGEPKFLYLSEGLENHATAKMSFYDMNMDITNIRRKDYKPLGYNPEKPKNFEQMKKLAKILSKDIPHLRVDFYEINNQLYFGELTFFTSSGFVPWENEKTDKTLGDMIDLSLAYNIKEKKHHEK